jgi:FAD/FMN-containing dehydrogenase
VLEMDVLTGAGEIVTARPDGEHADLFDTFPNSYGTLGYATRIRIELEPTEPFVALQHIRFDDLDELAAGIVNVIAEGNVDFLDGVVFRPDQAFLTLGRFVDSTSVPPSDYTGQRIYYKSIAERMTDTLTIYDYLWRWDTDWFWCSRAFGVQHPVVRRLWPRRYRRSDVYHRLVGFENRWQVMSRINRTPHERVVQDVEIPVGRLAEFLRWFDDTVGMRPVWLCPLRLRGEHRWPLYPLTPGETYVNVGFWGAVPIRPGAADGDLNRAIESAVAEHDGHKSLYSDAYYDRETFDRLYDVPALEKVKDRYDPGSRLTGLYEKAVGRR